MKKLGTLAMTFALLAAVGVNAAETSGEGKEQEQPSGSITGMMVGAVGGPIGALFGSSVGALFGGSGEKVIRSPNREFTVGDEVETRGNRMYENASLSESSTGGSNRN